MIEITKTKDAITAKLEITYTEKINPAITKDIEDDIVEILKHKIKLAVNKRLYMYLQCTPDAKLKVRTILKLLDNL